MSDGRIQHPLSDHNELGPVLRALRDLRDPVSSANDTSKPSDRTSRDDPSSNSTEAKHVAQRLARIIASCQHDSDENSKDVLQINHDAGGGRAELSHDSCSQTGTSDAHHGVSFGRVLNEELVLLCGQALGAESVLPAHTLASIVSPLADFAAKAVYSFAIAHHLDEGSRLTTSEATTTSEAQSSLETYLGMSKISTPSSTSGAKNRKSCHVWAFEADARRHVLRYALAVKYGSAEAAPTAMKFAGAPLVLYVREQPQTKIQILSEKLTFASRQAFARYGSSLSEWRDITSGICAFETLNLKDVSEVRSQVSLCLKSAVKLRNFAPVLVVINADLDTTICGGLEVLRAVCDSYGACLHAEGVALGLLAAQSTLLAALPYDLSSCISQCHSLLFDIGASFGLRNLAVVNYIDRPHPAISPELEEEFQPTKPQQFGSSRVESVETIGKSLCAREQSLSRVLALWWLFQRMDLSTVRSAITAAASLSAYLADNLSNMTQSIELQAIGCGANLLISYSKCAVDSVYRTAVNRAIVKELEGHETTRHLEVCLVGHDNEILVLFSPFLAWQRNCPVSVPHCLGSDHFARRVAAAVGRCEFSRAGASTFVASVRQCEHLELADITALDIAPLYFGAVRVVPFGLACGHGQWSKDPDIIHQVEKLTCALAPGVALSPGCPFEFVFFDNAVNVYAPFVCVGPTEEMFTKNFASRCAGKPGHQLLDDVTSQDSVCPEPNGATFPVEYARTIGREAGCAVSEAARTLLRGLPLASEISLFQGLKSDGDASFSRSNGKPVDFVPLPPEHSICEVAEPVTENSSSRDYGTAVDSMQGQQGTPCLDIYGDHDVDAKSDTVTQTTFADNLSHHSSSIEMAMQESQSCVQTKATVASSIPMSGHLETSGNSRQVTASGVWEMFFGESVRDSEESDCEGPQNAGDAEQMDLFRL